MKLPFFNPEHPEFKAHVAYVAGELHNFRLEAITHQGLRQQTQRAYEEARAKDIVLHITSHKPTWWERLLSRLRGEQTVDMFEAGLEKWLREAIERAKPAEYGPENTFYEGGWNDATAKYHASLLRELGINDASDGSKEDE